MCESWLLPEIPSSSIAVKGFRLIRNDTDSGKRKHGVCVYVRDDLALGHVHTDHPNTVGIVLPEFNLLLLVVYRPPSNTLDMDLELVDFISSMCDRGSVCLMGDFNLPTVDWSSEPPAAASYRDRIFLDCFAQLGLSQHVLETTFVPSGRTLDLVLTSEGERITTVTTLPPLPGCGHVPVGFSMAFPVPDSHPHTFVGETSRRDWFRGDYTSMSRIISEIDWVSEFSGRDLEDAYGHFSDRIHKIMDIFVPSSADRPRKTLPGNRNLPNHLRSRRADAWSNYKITRSQYGRISQQALVCWHNFVSINGEIRRYKMETRCSYELRLLDSMVNNPKGLHSYLRSHKADIPRIGPVLVGNELTDDPLSMAECFVESFVGVLNSAVVPHHPQAHQFSDSVLSDVPFTLSNVKTALSALDPTSSMGPDGFHPLMLKSCSESISLPLYLLFTRSLSVMIVPRPWKLSNVVPIFKKGSHSDPLNYRPISLTSVCSKTMERILTNTIHQYLEINNILSNAQFGFRPGRSVQEQLILTYNYVTREYDLGRVVELILFDFKKAFDLVPHGILLDKLFELGFRDPVLGWMGDFLCGRLMRVVVGGSASSSRPVCSGVPQGSVLGPLLFIIFINHLVHDLHSVSHLFADDLKLYLGISRCPSSYVDGVGVLQSDIDTLFARATSWGLQFASHKCVRVRFVRPYADSPCPEPINIDGFELPVQSEARDLGVDVDTTLRFHRHISSISSKALGVSANILRGTVCRSPEFMKKIFIAHIRPLMDFCSTVWNTGYITDIKSLEAVQRRWTKRIDGLSNMQYSERLRYLSLFSIWGRLLRADLILTWKITHGLSPSLAGILPLSGIGITRGHRFKLAVHHTETEVRRRFFTRRVVTEWNNLPAQVVESTSLDMFKSRLHKALGDLLFYYHD